MTCFLSSVDAKNKKVAMSEEYLRPFMLDKKQQTWTGFPSDYVFLVSARSETVSLASLEK